MKGNGMDEQPPADLDSTLRAWGRAAVLAQERSPRSYALDTPPAARPGRAILAAVAAVVALGASAAIWNAGGTQSPTPVGRTSVPCQQQFAAGRVVVTLQSLPPTVSIALTYVGKSKCTIDGHAPRVELRDGKGRVLLEQSRSATFDLRQLDLVPGDDISFDVRRFLGCFAGPPDAYTLVVFPDPSDAGNGVAVPVRQQVSSTGSASCRQTTIGDVSNLRRGA